MKTEQPKNQYTIQVQFIGEPWHDSWCPRTANIPSLKLAWARLAQMPGSSGSQKRRWRIFNVTTQRPLRSTVTIYEGLEEHAKNETEFQFDKAALLKEIADLKESSVMWRAKYVSLLNRVNNIKAEIAMSGL